MEELSLCFGDRVCFRFNDVHVHLVLCVLFQFSNNPYTDLLFVCACVRGGVGGGSAPFSLSPKGWSLFFDCGNAWSYSLVFEMALL